MRIWTGLFIGFCLVLQCPAFALTPSDAHHLLARTGFGGASPSEIQALLPLSRVKAVDKILRKARKNEVKAPPNWMVDTKVPHWKKLSRSERKVQRKERRKKIRALKGWWLERMIKTPSPLSEKMTLFWHNHFVSSVRKVRHPFLMHRQQMVFRNLGFKRFDTLLSEMLKDPALLLYLDAHRNRLKQPNENFARELFELFTLGEGHYSEQDIKEAARALTGIRLNPRKGFYRFLPRQHDKGLKTIFGKRGNWGPEDVQRLILKRSETSRFIVKKIYTEFLSHPPSQRELKRLAYGFEMNYEISPLLRHILLSKAFWADKERGQMIKSPVDFLVGSLRTLEVQPQNYAQIAQLSRRLGQDLYAPPNVKGWPGGQIWITSQTLLLRQQTLSRFLRARHGKAKGMKMMQSKGRSPLLDMSFNQLETLLLPLPSSIKPQSNKYKNIAALFMDARYQLK